MAAPPIYNPQVPCVHPIPGGMYPGRMIRVQGNTPPGAQRFAINCQCGPNTDPRDDIALHLNFRFIEQCVVRNHLSAMNWGVEDTNGNMPLNRGESFEVLILCEMHSLKIAVNGVHFCEFLHRLPFQRISHVTVDGDVMLQLIGFEGAAPPPQQMYGGMADPQYGGQYGAPPPAYGAPGYGAPQAVGRGYGPPMQAQYPQNYRPGQQGYVQAPQYAPGPPQQFAPGQPQTVQGQQRAGMGAGAAAATGVGAALIGGVAGYAMGGGFNRDSPGASENDGTTPVTPPGLPGEAVATPMPAPDSHPGAPPGEAFATPFPAPDSHPGAPPGQPGEAFATPFPASDSHPGAPPEQPGEAFATPYPAPQAYGMAMPDTEGYQGPIPEGFAPVPMDYPPQDYEGYATTDHEEYHAAEYGEDDGDWLD